MNLSDILKGNGSNSFHANEDPNFVKVEFYKKNDIKQDKGYINTNYIESVVSYEKDDQDPNLCKINFFDNSHCVVLTPVEKIITGIENKFYFGSFTKGDEFNFTGSVHVRKSSIKSFIRRKKGVTSLSLINDNHTDGCFGLQQTPEEIIKGVCLKSV